MSNAPKNTPDIVEDIVDNAAQKQPTTLDVNEFAEVADQNEEVVARAKTKLESREQWEALKATISTERTHADNADVIQDPDSHAKLDELETQIDQAIAIALPEAELPQSPQRKLAEMTGKIGDVFRKVSETVGTALQSMGSGVAGFLISLFEASDSGFMKGIANWIRGIAEPGMIREAMESALGKGKIRSAPEDRGHAQTLRAQYQAKLAAEKLAPETYSFETFYTEKISQLPNDKETYTIADLAAIRSPEAAAVAAETEAVIKEKTANIEHERKLAENPERAYVEAFRDALNSIKPNSVPVEEDETIPQIVTKILRAFRDVGDAGYTNFGLEVSGGDLEEADGSSNPFGGADWDMLDNWEVKMRSNPIGGIRDFLSVDPAAWESTNPTAARTLQDVRAFMEKRGIGPAAITSGNAPEAPPAEPEKDAPPPVDFTVYPM